MSIFKLFKIRKKQMPELINFSSCLITEEMVSAYVYDIEKKFSCKIDIIYMLGRYYLYCGCDNKRTCEVEEYFNTLTPDELIDILFEEYSCLESFYVIENGKKVIKYRKKNNLGGK